MLGMADDEEFIEKSFMALSSAAIKSQDSINRNLVTVMVGNKALDNYCEDVIIRDFKLRLQEYVLLATPR